MNFCGRDGKCASLHICIIVSRGGIYKGEGAIFALCSQCAEEAGRGLYGQDGRWYNNPMEKWGHEKKHGKKRRGLWPWLICIVVLAAAAYLWFGVYGVELLNDESGAEPREASVLPEPEALAPQDTPQPEPTISIPVPEVCLYTARLTLEEQRLYGGLRIHYVNTAEDTLYAIPFHLYPNTLSPGALNISRLSLDGKAAYFIQDGALLTVPMVVELAPGEDCVIYMELELDLSGEYGSTDRLELALPAAAVYENEWLTDALPEDAGYTAPATYSVMLTGDVLCPLEETEPGHYYGENIQGMSLELK